ncbi:M14 metallopeptidase family protein [Novosphingobium profundi]|uniref:M14 family metallopeptidase n=1 Tax=Novosphingobium profundi TaxID=1774954 RepID=UPI001CFEF25D|nr:M14 metallopeptidase family protein [Novosphingobium profundi]
MRIGLRAASFTAMALLLTSPGLAQISQPNTMGIATPAESFPQEPGSDYFLANYDQYEAYLKTLASQSDRMKLVDIGKSAEGRTMWVAIVSSPENLAKLDHYKDINARLAKAKGLDDAQAQALAEEGKAVVWIDAGMHATETVTTQSQIHVLYRMLTKTDAETKRILDDVIILFGHDNPDGLQLVADWYMRNEDPEKREFRTIPRLYQKYVGHDNNRDSFMAQMPETENVNRVLFREWFPQIIFNQHQTGPEGMVVFVPPFRDPFNYNYDPLLMTELQEVGSTMHSRLIAENKPGSGMRSSASYSTWHNGMERSVSYFHNSIGLLTEIIGGPTPMNIPLVPEVQLPDNDKPMPIAPREWHLADSLEYQWSLDRAVLDYASRNRDRLLFNYYRMGKNSIEEGLTDSWTTTPTDIEELQEAGKDRPAPKDENSYFRANRVDPALYGEVLQASEKRDPRAYVISRSQRDLPTTVAFLNALLKNGVEVLEADAPFSAAGTSYPAGSWIVKTSQAYRPHVLDMFEPQDHPHDVEYPGGPPKRPYDITGYTLSDQMGVGYDRVFETIDPAASPITGLLDVPAGQVVGSGDAGWLVRHETNNSFILTNRLLKAGLPVSWIKSATRAGDVEFAPGAVWIPASGEARSIVEASVKDLGINAYAQGTAPSQDTMAIAPVRVGLVDQYGGVMPSGWTRWLFEQYEFPFEVVFPSELDQGNLADKFDVLVFANGTVPPVKDGPWSGRPSSMPDPETIPAEYRSQLGLVSEEKTAPALAAFAKEGGTIIAIGNAARLATMLKAPLVPALAKEEDGELKGLTTSEFFIPGALVEARVDPSQPLAYGITPTVDMFFDRSQSFTFTGGGSQARKVSWYESPTPLKSGWAMGQEKLQGTTAIADVDLGKGKLFVMGPEVTQRAQPYPTFKFLFNGILYGPSSKK